MNAIASFARVALATLGASGFLSGCTAPADHPALANAALPPLIQAHRLAYRGTMPGSYQISPDGRKLAWIGPSLGRSALFVRDNATGDVRRHRARLSNFQWTPDSRRLLFASDPGGGENPHVFMLDTVDPNADAVDLTPYPEVHAAIQHVVAGPPVSVLVTHNRRDPKLFDLYRIDLESRRETLVAANPGDGVGPLIAHDGSLQGWSKPRDAERSADFRRAPLVARKRQLEMKPEETFRVLGLGHDGSYVWALSDRGRDRIALVIAHPRLGWEKVVFGNPDVDVSEVMFSRVTRAPLLAQAIPGNPRTEILDPKLREDLAELVRAQGEQPYMLKIASADAEEKRLVVSIHTAVTHRYYFVDRPKRAFTLLAEGVEPDLAQSLVPLKPIALDARDGLRLHGYLALPAGVEARRLPTVVLVHGGPWRRTAWGDPLVSEDALYAQFLANRGYAVLMVDFRGSTGYGQKFYAAGMGEFAGRMHEDLLDAVKWAIDDGIADPGRIAIMGWSYGGYAALVGMTMTPEVFACGVSLNGPTDLASLIESFPPYWKLDLSRWHDFVGNPAIAEDRHEMNQKSPLRHATGARRPVLIVHGGRDVRVRIDQSERMVAALRAAGKPVEYLAIPEMSHSMSYWAHRLAVLRRSETFLRTCLGGRASRFDPFDALAWTWERLGR